MRILGLALIGLFMLPVSMSCTTLQSSQNSEFTIFVEPGDAQFYEGGRRVCEASPCIVALSKDVERKLLVKRQDHYEETITLFRLSSRGKSAGTVIRIKGQQDLDLDRNQHAFKLKLQRLETIPLAVPVDEMVEEKLPLPQ